MPEISEGTTEFTLSVDIRTRRIAPRLPGAIEHSCYSRQRRSSAVNAHRGVHGEAVAVVPLCRLLGLVFVQYCPACERLQDAVAHSVLNRLGVGAMEDLGGEEASAVLPSSLPPTNLPISVVSGSEIILAQEKIDFPDFLADSFWIFPEEQITFPQMSRHRRLHLLLRSIIGIV